MKCLYLRDKKKPAEKAEERQKLLMKKRDKSNLNSLHLLRRHLLNALH